MELVMRSQEWEDFSFELFFWKIKLKKTTKT